MRPLCGGRDPHICAPGPLSADSCWPLATVGDWPGEAETGIPSSFVPSASAAQVPAVWVLGPGVRKGPHTHQCLLCMDNTQERQEHGP